MKWWNPDIWGTKSITEEIKAFRNKGDNSFTDKALDKRAGEGVDDISVITGYGRESMSSFNTFYKNSINISFESEVQRVLYYRSMSEMPEIADVVEDAIIESTQSDEKGNVLSLEITDPEMEKNENIVMNITDAFNDLFFRNLNINDIIWDLMRTFFIDGKVFFEQIIHEGRAGNGVVSIKKLPTETMDRLYDPKTGKTLAYYQYLTQNPKRPATIEEARQDTKIIVFDPNQIGYLDYGIYGKTKSEVLGYLEKTKQPFNSLKLLETSVIIYRIVRAPERLVFKIDTGSMPKDKSMAFVEKIKNKFTKKIGYDGQTGQLTNSPEIFSMLENFFLPQSSDGNGSDITSIGGNPSGFAELDDIYYFARKLYRAMKYPMSRVTAQQEKRESDNVFGGTSTGEITRDEIKWAKFLERQQGKFTNVFMELFLIHLNFTGLKKEYGIDRSKIRIKMTPPNQYKQQMQQQLLETQTSNYSTLSNNAEFSKYFLMKEYLHWDDAMIKANSDGFKKDKELGFDEEDGGF
jgi:hypothetical protein